MYAIAIHGGAGGLPPQRLSSEQQRRYHDGLAAALDRGYAVLEDGGSSLEAVIAAVRILEDDPLFNAGRGAALTREGIAELDAAVMDGSTLRAGGVAAVRHVKHPIELARRVMEKSRHVLLVGAG
ncbi:peptidase T2, asparaginase 2, partial [mine drainage metagenome]